MRAKEILGVIECDSSELRGSYESALKINKIGGVCVQGENPTPTNPQEIKKSVVSEIRTHGKNFLKNTIESKTQGGVTFTVDDDGCITANGTSTGNVVLYFNNIVNKLEVGKKYIASGVHAVEIIYADGKYDYKSNFVFSKNMVEVKPYIQITSGVTVTDKKYYPMIEEGSVATEYEAYTESIITLSQPIELYGIGDVQDVIEGGKVVRKFGKLNLEDLTWTREEDHNLWISGAFNKAKNDKILMCETIPYARCTTGNGVNGTRVNRPYNLWARNGSSEITPSGKAIYELEEPTVEDLPLTDQIALNCLKTFHGYTYVEFAGEVQPTLNSEYATNLEGTITLQAHADNRIGKANTLVNRAEGESDVFEVKVEHGLVYLYKDDVLHGILGANNVITNGESYKTMNVRAEEDADFIALTNKKTNAVCYYMNINQIPFTSAQYKEAHYFGGDARFTGRVVGNEHIVGKNLQAQQMVFAQAVEASISLISKGDIIGKDLYITNLSVNGGEPQPVEWVWDTSLERYVLCATGKVQGE